MSINATTSSSASVNSTTSSSQVSNAASSDVSKKSSTDSSFKEEMDKVSSSEKNEDSKKSEDVQDNKVAEVSEKSEDSGKNSADDYTQDNTLNQGEVTEFNKFASLAMMDVNTQLSSDIKQMVDNNTQVNSIFQMGKEQNLAGLVSLENSQNSISMTQADAEFFVNLTQQNDVSAQNVVAQTQNLINGGVEVSQAKQSSQISQTLLNALVTAKENNQPLRIDFDQNVSVILRVGKDGALAANFIPGDKAVEQYLRNNIDSLKATFRENDLPYSDLSYSNRGSKQQKENRRNKQ